MDMVKLPMMSRVCESVLFSFSCTCYFADYDYINTYVLVISRYLRSNLCHFG